MKLTPDVPDDSDDCLFGQVGSTHLAPGRSEEIHIRNFDVSRSYDLRVIVSDGDEAIFTNRYHLSPGQTRSVLGQLRPGEYEIHVTLDGRRQRTVRCAVDGTPERTALIEVGNGTLSVTEGLYC